MTTTTMTGICKSRELRSITTTLLFSPPTPLLRHCRTSPSSSDALFFRNSVPGSQSRASFPVLSSRRNSELRRSYLSSFHIVFSFPSDIVFSFPSDSHSGGTTPNEDEGFVVVNFYHFVRVEDPETEVAKHLAFLQGRDIHGRIYLNEQGINAQYSGPMRDALRYVDWLKEDFRFSDILVQISPTPRGHAFPRLKLRYKPSLVQLEGGISHLPLTDPAMRATPLPPSEWKKRLQALNSADEESMTNNPRKLLLLDVRNGYEWDIGHFKGAKRPNVDCFRTTSFGLSEAEETDSDPLAGVDKEGTDVLMYCTGGIRCDVYSTILRKNGFQNLYTLRGGVSHYLKSEGPAKWVGNLFVFDSRLSLPPSDYKSGFVDEDTRNESRAEFPTFAKCHICRSHVHDFRHRNCANIDCNLLFLSCMNCVEEYGGCCCLDCKSAPRIRPVLPGYQRYQKWHIYRDNLLLQRT